MDAGFQPAAAPALSVMVRALGYFVLAQRSLTVVSIIAR